MKRITAEDVKRGMYIIERQPGQRGIIENNTPPTEPKTLIGEVANEIWETAKRNFVWTKKDWQNEALRLEEKTGIGADILMQSGREGFDNAKKMEDMLARGRTIDEINMEFPELNTVKYGSEAEAILALQNMQSVKEARGIFDAVQQGIWKVNDEMKLYDAGYSLANTSDPAKIEELNTEIKRLQKNIESYRTASGFMERIASEGIPGLYRMGAQMVEGTDRALQGGVAGAGFGAMAGGIGAVPGFLAGAKWGLTAGMGEEIYKQSYGRRYLELAGRTSQNGTRIYTDEEARDYAGRYAIVDAAIEMAAFRFGAKAIAAATPKKQLAKMVADVSTGQYGTFQKGLGAVAAQMVKAGIKTGGAELAEEGLQDINESVQHALWRKDGDVAAKSFSEMGASAVHAMWDALPAVIGMGVFGGFGGGVRTIKNYHDFKKMTPEAQQLAVQTEMNTMGNTILDGIVQSSKTNELAKESPALYGKIIQAQADRVGVSTIFINAHELVDTEQGQIALQDLVNKGVIKQNEVTNAIENELPIEIELGSFAQLASTLEEETVSEIKNTSFYTKGGISLETIRKSVDITNAIKEKFAGEYEKRKESVKEEILDTHFKDATKVERDVLDMILADPYKIKEGFNEVYRELESAYRETYADEYTTLQTAKNEAEKPGWYNEYVAANHKAPGRQAMRRLAFEVNKKQTLEELGADLLPEAMEQVNQKYNEMEEKLVTLEALDKIKDRLFEIADSDIYLRTTLTKEGLEVYNAVKDYMKMGNDEVALQAKEGALLFAAHADVMASIIRKAGNSRFTAMDYYNQYVEMRTGKQGSFGRNSYGAPLNVGIDLNKEVSVVDLTGLLDVNEEFESSKLVEKVKSLIGKATATADNKAIIEVIANSAKHIVYSGRRLNYNAFRDRGIVVENIIDLIKESVLIETIPNRKKSLAKWNSGIKLSRSERRKRNKKLRVNYYHRFYVPVKINDKILVVRIVAEEFINRITLNPLDVKLYDVIIEDKEKKVASPTTSAQNEGVHLREREPSLSTITIHEMLSSVKDYNGNPYINEDGTGNFAQLKEKNYGYYQKKEEITNTKAFKEWFGKSKLSVNNRGTFDGNNPNIYAQTAWHGSPHKFDSFDLGAIGTGEGAQAHGWGLYFAKDKVIAENYRDVLGANSVSIKVNNEAYHLNETEWVNLKTGEVLEYQSDLDLALTSLKTNKTVEGAITDLESTIKKHKNKTSETSKHLVIATQNAIKVLKNNSFEVNITKSLFEVDIPEDNVLLDEDKLLSNQSNYIQESVNKAIGNLELDKLLQFTNKINLTASNQYNLLIKEYNDLYSLIIAPKMISGGTRRKTYFKDILKKEGYDEDDILKLSNDKELGERESEKLKKENKEKIEGIKKKILPEISNAIKKGVISEFSGGEVYVALAETLGGIKNASLYLNEYGVNGITYEGARDGRCFVVFDDKAIKVIERYNQEKNAENIRGLTTLLRENKKRIELFDIANVSTFVHECGHVFLEDLQMLAHMEGTTDQVREDWEKIKEWTGYIEGASADENRAAHEKFATAFEAYLREGKAPKKGLQRAFRRFKEWLVVLYKSVKKLGGMPPKEITDIMDRMLATEEEINAWSAAKELDSFEETGLFKTLAESEQVAMQEWLDDIREGAKERIIKAYMKELKGKGAKAYEEKKAEIRANIEKMLVETYPIYKERMKYEQFGIAYLAAQTQYKTIKDLETAEEAEGLGKWEEVIKNELETAREEMDTSAITPEEARGMAEDWLLSSDGQQRLTEEEAKAIKRRTNREVAEKWNLLSKLETIDVNAEDFTAELAKLLEKEEVQQDIKQMQSDNADNQTMANAAKNALKVRIQQMRALRNIEVGRAEDVMDKAHAALKEMTVSQAISFKEYQRKSVTEARKADIAISKGKMDEAFFHKNKQIHYQAMARAAYDNEKEVEKMRDRLVEQLKRFTRPKSPIRIMPSSRYFYHKVMYELSLASTSGVEPLDGFNLVDVLNTLDVDAELMGLENKVQLNKWILDLFSGEKPTSWKRLTLSQFEEISELLNAIYTQGKQKYEGSRILNAEGKSISFERAAQEMIEQASKRLAPKDANLLSEENEKTWQEKGLDTLGSVALSLLKVETILDRLDDNNKHGAWHRYVYEPINQAAQKSKAMLMEATKEFSAIFKTYTSNELFEIRNERLYKVGEISNMTREQVIMLALNWGTENNRQRVMETVQADAVTVEKAFNDFLDDKDWDFVERTWALINSYFDERSAVQERMYGSPMKKEKGITFTIGSRQIEGDYFPIVYDPKVDSAAKEYEVEDIIRSQLSSNAVWGMGLSATKQRVKFVKNKKLLLNFTVIPRAIDEAINHIAMREAAVDVNRLIGTKEIEDYVMRTMGVNTLQTLKKWVRDNWQEEIATQHRLDRMLNTLRKNTTLAIIGYRTSTALLNVLNLSPMIHEIGIMNTLYALRGFYKPSVKGMQERYEFVMGKSLFLKQRVTNLDRDLQKGLAVDGNSLDYFYGDEKKKALSKAVHLSKEAKEKINAHAYTFIAATDLMLSMPLWLHVYQEHVTRLLKEGKTDEIRIEEEAISQADRAVRNVFGSGETKDTAGLQRDKRSRVMLFTPFYSYMNTVFNALAKAGYIALDKKDYAPLFNAVLHWIVITSIGEALMRAMLDGEDDDIESIFKKIMLGIVGNTAGSLPIIRDAVSLAMYTMMGEYTHNRGNEAVALSVLPKMVESINAGKSDTSDWVDLMRKVSQTGNRVFGFSDTISDGWWTFVKWALTDIDADVEDVIYSIMFDKRLKGE